MLDPLSKYAYVDVSTSSFLWGVVLTLHAVAENYAGLMVLRTLLGVFESAISPGFSLITGMWYTPREHVSRHSFWFAGNATASLIGSGIAYGILQYTGSFSQWKVSSSYIVDGRTRSNISFRCFSLYLDS